VKTNQIITTISAVIIRKIIIKIIINIKENIKQMEDNQILPRKMKNLILNNILTSH